MDFNQAHPQQSFTPISKGTIAKVHMTIKPGNYNDPARGWMGGYATYNPVTSALYLDCEFTVMEGQYAERKIWGRIGLYSPLSLSGVIGHSFVGS